MSKLFRHFGTLAVGLFAAVAVGCAGSGDSPEPDESTSTPSPTQTATAAPALTETPEPTAAVTPTQPGLTSEPTATQAPTTETGYNSTDNMYRLFSGRDQDRDDTQEAITLAVANNDRSMVPVLIEMLRFFGDRELVIETNAALSALSGYLLMGGSSPWSEWMEWLGKNADDYHPPDGYVQWKSDLMSLIDPRFGEFLAPAEQGSRINVAEIAWGGVRPDGIPDLQNSPVLPASEQGYLQPSDRVFGVSINGEHRAYPLRIVNAHEMANDTLGGEPIALAY